MNRLAFYILLCGASFIPAFSTELTTSQVDETVNKAMTVFQVPGLSLAIVKDGKVVYSKGYGIRSVEANEKIDSETLFGIASLSKAFTCAALAILVDEGKLSWSDRVVDLVPGFQLFDPYVTREFQVVDLLTHRSGLPLGAGDLMIWPTTDFTKDEVIYNLRFLKPVSSFRTKFDYDNLLYMVAGEVVSNVSGQPWSDFVQDRIFKPLGMTRSTTHAGALSGTENLITPHTLVDGKLVTVPRFTNEMIGPAGGIYSNAEDMAKWIQMLLNEGHYGLNQDQTLLSEKQHWNLFQVRTLLPTSRKSFEETKTYFRGYALGWFVSNENGFLKITHTGGLPGNVCRLTLIPELELGVIVLLNQQTGEAMHAISDQIVRGYMDLPWEDQVEKNLEKLQKKRQKAQVILDDVKKILSEADNQNEPEWASSIEGSYRDAWYGLITISKQKDGPRRIQFSRTPQLVGDLVYLKGTTFVAKWDDRTFDADAYVTANVAPSGRVDALAMKAISPLTDFSYDFRHLELKKEGDRQ